MVTLGGGGAVSYERGTPVNTYHTLHHPSLHHGTQNTKPNPEIWDRVRSVEQGSRGDARTFSQPEIRNRRITKLEVRNPTEETRNLKHETSIPKPEIRNSKGLAPPKNLFSSLNIKPPQPETRITKYHTATLKHEIRNLHIHSQLETRNPKPGPRTPDPETRNPKPGNRPGVLRDSEGP